MKKFFKIILAIGAIGAGVAGGLFLYSKIKAKRNAADDDFEDEFDDDDVSFVDITPSKDTED
ncbi:MAG: hypothetical protein PUA49_01860 [Butyrivibrio sp.]|nr:hypothetical protein [Butyrivibrio sp.]